MENFGKTLKKLIKDKRVTATDVSEATGIPKSTLSEWMSGRTPSIVLLLSFQVLADEKKWSVFVGKNFNSEADAKGVSYTNTAASYTEDYTYEFEGLGLSLGAEYNHSIDTFDNTSLVKDQGAKISVVFGASYELERGSDGVSFSFSDGSSGNAPSSIAKDYSINIISFYSNLEVLLTNNLIIFVGGSYNIANLEAPSPSKLEADSSFGYQVGAGYNWKDYNMKFTYKPMTFDLSGNDTAGNAIAAGEIEYNQMVLSFGYKI